MDDNLGAICYPTVRFVIPREDQIMAVRPIPEGFHTVTPYLVVQGADKLIAFLKHAFDAQEIHRTMRPDGAVMHAEIKIGDSHLMMSEGGGPFPAMPAAFYLYVKDVDAVYKQAIQAGGISVGEPVNQFYGDRSGGVKDAFGNIWWIGTHVEDVPPEKLEKLAAEAMKQRASQ